MKKETFNFKKLSEQTRLIMFIVVMILIGCFFIPVKNNYKVIEQKSDTTELVMYTPLLNPFIKQYKEVHKRDSICVKCKLIKISRRVGDDKYLVILKGNGKQSMYKGLETYNYVRNHMKQDSTLDMVINYWPVEYIEF